MATIDDYFSLAERDLRDLLGAKISHGITTEGLHRIYGRPEPREVWVLLPRSSRKVCFSRSALVFSGDEARLLRAYAQALHEFSEVPRSFAPAASGDVLTRAIAVRCTDDTNNSRTLETVMQSIVQYATRTYEGVRIAMNMCLDLNAQETGVPLTSFLDEAWAPVMGSGLVTAVRLAGDGSALSVIDLEFTQDSDILAPDSFTALAEWTGSTGRIGLSVTRSGEVYLFANQQLLFARRNSRWRGFPLDLVKGSGWFGSTKRQLSPPVKGAILTSLLDASAAHHGACIGILARDQVKTGIAKLLAPDDSWSSESHIPSRMINQTHFQALSRRRRLELLSMDGATLLDQSGRILAGGAILKVRGGSPGGGRTAAAQALSRYGVGIKVSQDGPIKAFVQENGEMVEQFSMG